MTEKRFKTIDDLKEYIDTNKIDLRVILDNDDVTFTNNLDYDNSDYEEFVVNGLGHGYSDLMAIYSYIFKESHVEWC